MGQVCCQLFEEVLTQEAFDKKQNGPTLRRLFGAYQNADFWAVYRRFRAIDDGNGVVSWDELQQCVSLETHQLFFLWDTFSHQNELIFARELMTVICTFSSAPLIEKAKFLQALFDDSQTGLNTAAEIVVMLNTVLNVLTKCTGVAVKARDVKVKIFPALQELLPSWEHALERCHGKSEDAFNQARFIGQIEMELLIPTLQEVYKTLPIAQKPPPGAMQPPPPDWATPASLEKGVSKPPPADNKTQRAAGHSAAKLSKAELSHLEWMAKMDDNEEEGKENSPANFRRATPKNADEASPSCPPAKCWMVIYGADFSKVAKDLASFRHLFISSVSTALGIPKACVEEVGVQRSSMTSGGVIVEFVLQPSGRGSDTRDGDTLKQALQQQLSLAHSALRKGAFKDYAPTAELVEKPQKNRAASPEATQAPAPGRKSGKDQYTQTETAAQDEGMKEALEDLEKAEAEARRWQEKAVALEEELKKLKGEA